MALFVKSGKRRGSSNYLKNEKWTVISRYLNLSNLLHCGPDISYIIWDKLPTSVCGLFISIYLDDHWMAEQGACRIEAFRGYINGQKIRPRDIRELSNGILQRAAECVIYSFGKCMVKRQDLPQNSPGSNDVHINDLTTPRGRRGLHVTLRKYTKYPSECS